MLVTGYISCKNFAEAKKIANALLQKRLIACANIINKVNSIYWWQKKIESSKESLLLIKTRKALAKKIIAEVKKIHSYKIPCIEFIEIKNSGKDFEKWVENETKK